MFTLETAREVLDYLVRCTAKHLHEFDAIAVSGYSSAMIAPALAMAINKNIVLVRKPSEHRNSGYGVEGVHNQRVLFVDDLVASGSTFERVQQGLLDIGCEVVGYVLYQDQEESMLLHGEHPGVKYFGM